MRPDQDFYLRDGVHLHVKGQYLLYRSHRGAILTALIKLLMICLLDDGRCLVFICSPLLMAIFVLHFILFAEGLLSILFHCTCGLL